MPLVVVGVLLLAAKLAELGPFANWSWWIILAPFGAAVLWWQFADSSGWTQRRVMDKMAQRQKDRRERQMDALGLNRKREKQVTRARQDKARQASADPTQQGGDVPPPLVKPLPPPAPPPRREPRL